MNLFKRMTACCLFLLCAAGRPPSDLEKTLSTAEEFEQRGALDAARRQLRAVIRHTPNQALAQRCALRVCALWQRQGELSTSRCCYSDLATTLAGEADAAPQRLEVQSHARFCAASLDIELGQVERGRKALVQLLDDLPYTGGARNAFTLARDLHHQLGGPASEAEFLTGVASRLAWVAERGAQSHEAPVARWQRRALLAETLVELGRIRFCEAHQPEAALRMLRRALPVARGTLWEDDALLWLARSERHFGQRSEALQHYRELIAAEGDPLGMCRGPHISPLYDTALFEIGQTLEEERRCEEAQAAYAELFVQAPVSRHLDDAAYRIAMIKARRTQQPLALRDFLKHTADSHPAHTDNQLLAASPVR
jgi:tetratricopeptide (TPR) repeat protein